MTTLADLETKAASDQPFTRADAERLASCTDLVTVGALGESVRRARRGNDVTYGRVLCIDGPLPAAGPGEAGEVRLAGPATDQAALVAHCKAHLAGYKCPKRVVFVDRVQRGPNGKPDYRWATEVAAG